MSDRYTELLEAVRLVNRLRDFWDGIYSVREAAATGDEGMQYPHASSWDLPSVRAYSDACVVIDKHLKGTP